MLDGNCGVTAVKNEVNVTVICCGRRKIRQKLRYAAGVKPITYCKRCDLYGCWIRSMQLQQNCNELFPLNASISVVLVIFKGGSCKTIHEYT